MVAKERDVLKQQALEAPVQVAMSEDSTPQEQMEAIRVQYETEYRTRLEAQMDEMKRTFEMEKEKVANETKRITQELEAEEKRRIATDLKQVCRYGDGTPVVSWLY